MTNQRLSIEVFGRVQGVGYRYFAQETAEALGITGWVRNTFNRTVEIEAQADETTLGLFCDRLREGPPLARVTDVLKHEVQALPEEAGFEVRA